MAESHWRLERDSVGWGVDVVGVMRPRQGKSPFANGAPVLGSPINSRLLVVSGWSGGRIARWAEGSEVGVDDWRKLIVQGQASELARYVPVRHGVEVWMLRGRRGALFGLERSAGIVCAVVDRNKAPSLRREHAIAMLDTDPWCSFCMWQTREAADAAAARFPDQPGLAAWLMQHAGDFEQTDAANAAEAEDRTCR
jgi:hypothetical protein